jgi:hypothetical protein
MECATHNKPVMNMTIAVRIAGSAENLNACHKFFLGPDTSLLRAAALVDAPIMG